MLSPNSILWSKSLFVILLFLLLSFTLSATLDSQTLSQNSNLSIIKNLQNGLVGYWRFDEGSGSIAYDYSGNGNNGTLINGPTWVDGILGKALEFDGVNDYVNIPDSSSLDINGTGITFMAWIYSPGFQDYGWIMGKGGSDWGQMVWWLLPRSSGAIRYGIKSGGTTQEQTDIPVGLATNIWQHVAVVYDGSYMRFYLNGVEKDSFPKTGNMDVNDYPVVIGLDGWNPSQHYKGKIDEVKIYNRALTGNEVKQDYEKANLVGYWKFDEGSGTVANDSSGFGNDGTLINEPIWVNGLPLLGKALEFDGVDDYVNIPDSSSLDINGTGITFMVG